MTTSEPHILAAARRRRIVPAAVASLLGSVGVHAAFAVAAAGIAWQLSHESPAASRDVIIRFEDPAAAEGEDDASGPIAQPAPPLIADLPKQPREEVAATAAAQLPAASELPANSMELPPSMLTAAPRLREHSVESAQTATGATASQGETELVAGTSGVRFAGLGASNARSVIYVVDASGPMITSMPRVIEELRRSVEQLSPAQKFSVVLFRRTDAALGAEVFAPVLMRATPSAKARLVEWLAQIKPAGASNPLAGLEAALALKPDAVFLLSRSIVRSGGGV